MVEGVEVLTKGEEETFPTLVLGLSHKAFENMTDAEGWAHWQGHDSVSKGDAKTCPVNVRMAKGYRAGQQHCECDTEHTFQTGCPTFAPVEYVLTDSPEGDPLRKEVFTYSQ